MAAQIRRRGGVTRVAFSRVPGFGRGGFRTPPMSFGRHTFSGADSDGRSPMPRYDLEFWYCLAAGVVLLVGLALSFEYKESSDDAAQTEAINQFERTADRLVIEIERRFVLPVYGMRDLAAMFAARGTVTREEFRRQVGYRDLLREFPGVRGFGFAERVPRGAMDAFAARTRADGAPGFRIVSSGASPELYVVKYIEPVDANRRALGFDMASEPARYAAIVAAIDRGAAVLTSPIVLLQDENRGPSFLYVLPMYDGGITPDTLAERRRRAIGVTIASLTMADLLGPIASEFEGQLAFELFDGEPDPAVRPLFSAGAFGGEGGTAGPELIAHRAIGDRILAVRIRPGAAFPKMIEGGGDRIGFAAAITASILLSVSLLLLAIGRSRALSLAESMTADLDRLARVARKTTNAIAITGPDRRVVWVNDGFEAMTGIDPQAALGRDILTFFSVSDIGSSALDRLERALADRLPFHGEYAGRRVGGAAYWSVSEIEPMADRSDAFCGFMWVQSDISELKRKEMALDEERRRAVSVSEAKSTFLANMSHEIRTPMNGVLGFSRLLAESPLAPAQRGYVSKIIASGETLLEIIGDILDFSKIEAGALTAERAPFDLDEVIGKSTGLFASAAAAKDVEFLVDIAGDVPARLCGDALRLGQVLLNLCGNALKFTNCGEIVVAIARLPAPPGKIELEFAVHDSGIGMSAETLGRLFKPFMQADASTTRRYGGSGLGLVISKSLIELMGGTIEVRSTEGVGSVFSFRLPFDIPADISDSDVVDRQDTALEKILVVDDNPIACRIAAKLVERLGYEVSVAAGGREALAALPVEGTDCGYVAVVLDCRMPGLDGIETAAEIRRRFSGAHRPGIVLVSAFPQDGAEARLAALALRPPLIKPLDRAALSKAILVAIGREDSQDDAPRAPARRFENVRILVVDDNDINRQVAAAALEREGATIVLADGGKAALSALAGDGGAFDAVLMDLHMPEVDGLTATRSIRADPRHAQLPIIGLTANAMREDLDACRAAGMADVVVKPFELETLYGAIARHLDGGPRVAHEAPRDERRAPEGQREIALDHLASIVGGPAAALSLLKHFRRNYADLADKLAAALRNDPGGEGARLCHEVRGAAGNLGATGLYAVLTRVETALRSKVAPIAEADIAAIVVRLQAVFDEIDARAAESSAAPVAKAGQGVPAAELEALRVLLRNANLAAEGKWRALEPRLDAAQRRAARDVGAAIENLDFATAERIISTMAGRRPQAESER